MGMTMTQKILAKAAGLSSVQPGQLIEARLNLVLGNDITTPVAITEFEKAGFTQVFDKDRIAIVLDHYTPCKDIKSAQLCKQAREFAHKHSITHFYDVGQVGVEHALIPEKDVYKRQVLASAERAGGDDPPAGGKGCPSYRDLRRIPDAGPHSGGPPGRGGRRLHAWDGTPAGGHHLFS